MIQIAIVFFILLVVAVPCVTLLLSWRRKRGETPPEDAPSEI
jgi:hypothetical protein